ncbi:MAG: transcriptional regulator [Methylotenera sp.]|nr:MAG: transcriptional regulator [Methylotenera sp.]PPD19055.1 MAG: transcriptional regulator [Methylotenera sp.]
MSDKLKLETINAIPHALANFDAMPSQGYVRLPVVKSLLGVSSATVWRMVKAGTLKTHKLTPRTTTFNVGELRAALAEKGGAQS